MKIDMNKFSTYNDIEKDEMAKELYEFEVWMKEKFGFQTYLYGGTLLGAIRDKDFIPHDNDIDVGFYIGEYDTETAINLIKNFHKELGSLIVWANKNKPGAISHFGILSPNKKFVFDCWSTWSYKGKLYGGAIDWGLMLYPGGLNYSDLFPVKTVKFRGMDLSIPKEFEKIFEIRYVNWKTPITDKKLGSKQYNS